MFQLSHGDGVNMDFTCGSRSWRWVFSQLASDWVLFSFTL